MRHLIRITFIFCVAALASCNFFQQTKPAQSPCVASNQQQRFDCFLDSLAQASDLEKVNAIRKYVAHRVDMGDEKKTVSSPFDGLQGFADNTLNARCTYASKILIDLLDYAGYTAYGYHCGYKDSFAGTHYFVLADLNGRLMVQDPFYNATFGYDFLTMLDTMKAGEYDALKPIEEPTVNELWFNQTQLDSATLLYGSSFGKIIEIDTIGGRVRMLLEHDYSSFTQTQLKFIVPYLQADGLPESYLSLYRKPIAVYDKTGAVSDSILSVIRAHL